MRMVHGSQFHHAVRVGTASLARAGWFVVVWMTVGCGAEIWVGDRAGEGGSSSTTSSSGGSAECAGVGPWREEVISEGLVYAGNLEMDATGELHAVIGFGELTYMHGHEGAWKLEPAGHSGHWNYTLALDASARVHVATYAYHWMYETGYLSNASGRWQQSVVAPTGSGGPAGIALRPDATPEIVLLSWPSDLWRATPATEGWSLESLMVPPRYTEQAPVLEIDDEGVGWLAYFGGSAGTDAQPELLLVRLEPDGRTTAMSLETHDHLAWVADMILDRAGGIHLAYVGEYTNLYYGHYAEGRWTSTVLPGAFSFPAEQPARIALDASGRPSIAASGANHGPPFYLSLVDGRWVSGQIGDTPRALTGLAVDERGAAHALTLETEFADRKRLFYGTNRCAE